ncbi:hypothetical protein [Fibrobacter sp. UWP2]|uniref:hypothetical protein n=1 Tax=Fibrobacter sp. UWP2 TaxID=1896216 RepID=UPI00091F3741|nr:hypothetical protein [Fibrobacter sp. UWP2]SHI35214.1 hypothetical protein SAMN05720471_101254 [Fibrobacter sp. UWP2]
MREAIKKVLFNADQTGYVTPSEQARARSNIGVEDLPAKTGHAGDILAVNSSATGIEWIDQPDLSVYATQTDLAGKQDVLTAGSNITILNNVISATDTNDVFLAEYGVATVAEISAAKNAGKEVLTLIPGTYYSTVAYLREVTRYGAYANFASVVSDGASVKIASVDSSGNWSNSTVNLATASGTSLVQKLNYGDSEASRVATLLIDSDDPEGYALLKADNVTKGHLVMGPYKGLLDSGINNGAGKGDDTTPLYIDSNGHFVTCNEMQKKLTAGTRISIGPGAQDTTVIANTMHESVVNDCITWDTLANNYDLDYYWGNWRVHVHLKGFSDWGNADEAIRIRINHSYASETGKIKLGSYQVQNCYKYKNGNTYDYTNSLWYYDGNDPYTTAIIPDQYGFKFHVNPSTPSSNMPQNQEAHRFLVDTGAPYGEWLELDASVRFMIPNAAPTSNGIYLLLKGKYAYSYQ